MIKAKFMRGSAYIDVKIEGRKIIFITPLLNFQPIKIDLDKIEEHKDKLSKMKFNQDLIKELSNLNTEEEMLEDLNKDLIKSGWRMHGSK